LIIEADTVVFRTKTAELAIPLSAVRSVVAATGGVTMHYAEPGAKGGTATAWFMNFGPSGTARQCASAIKKAVSGAVAAPAPPPAKSPAKSRAKAAPAAPATPLLEDECHVACGALDGRGTLLRDDGGIRFTGPFGLTAAYGAISAVRLIGETIALTFRKKVRGAEATGAMVTPARRARRWATELREAARSHEGEAMVAPPAAIKK
jgi:hypothetical protein